METLTKTALFCLFMQPEGAGAMEDYASMYKDFMRRLVQVCTGNGGDTPAYFILNYTRVELVCLQESYKGNGRGEK